MPLEMSRPLEVVRESSAALVEAAAERLAGRLGEILPGRRAEEREAASRQLAALVAALTRALSGDAGAPHRDVPAHVSTGALMAALGRELIESRPDPVVAPALLDAVRAWSALRDALSSASGSDGGFLEDEQEDLRTRMQGSDAFDLLVEIAHDFRSPLTSILFLAETIRDGHSGEVNDLQRSQLGLVYSAAFGLAAAASDVVDLARRGRGLVDEEPEPYALPEVFRDVERLVSPIAEEKGLELRIDVPPHGRARGHPHALSRVLLNLTTNALKFTDSGAVELGVRRLPHDRIEFYVQDTGRGIPEARQKDLFHPFKKRLGESQEGHFFSGSGVGLTIARRLVRAMGSELRFNTSDEEGTRFFFELQANPRT